MSSSILSNSQYCMSTFSILSKKTLSGIRNSTRLVGRRRWDWERQPLSDLWCKSYFRGNGIELDALSLSHYTAQCIHITLFHLSLSLIHNIKQNKFQVQPVVMVKKHEVRKLRACRKKSKIIKRRALLLRLFVIKYKKVLTNNNTSFFPEQHIKNLTVPCIYIDTKIGLPKLAMCV